MGVRFYIKDLPEDKILGVISDTHLSDCVFTDQFINWCKEQNIDAKYYSLIKKPLSRLSRRVVCVPVAEDTYTLIQETGYDEDSIAFEDDEAAMLFRMTWP